MQQLSESSVETAERSNIARMGNPTAAVEENFAVFQGLCRLATQLSNEGRFAESALYVQVAADYAWLHPTGLLASPELDSILQRIGAELPWPNSRGNQVRSNRSPRHVLHVLTEAVGVGGHTRFVWRWIQNDADRPHSVVLTRQGERQIPGPLKENAEATGGKFHCLDWHVGGFLTRVQALRRLAAGADHVVLHTSPSDVLPLIAFAGSQNRPPVTLVNHADHVFWLGGAIVDQVANFRESGRRLAQRRRGIAESRCPLVPVPLGPRPKPFDRSEAKKKLGLPEDAVVLLSIASSYKYASIGDVHFGKVLLPVLQTHKNAVLFVIGPKEDDEWLASSAQADGRLKVLGKRADTDLFYQAADIYLDSFPFSSMTSVLEAGSHGAPVASYRLHPREAEILYTDDLAVSPFIVQASSVEEYRRKISWLIENGESRRTLGEQTRDRITEIHEPGGWNRFLEAMYSLDFPASLDQAPDKLEPRREVGELDFRLAQIFAKSGVSRDLSSTMRNHIALFPLGERLRIWHRMFGGEWRSLPRLILSDWQKTTLNRIRSFVFFRSVK